MIVNKCKKTVISMLFIFSLVINSIPFAFASTDVLYNNIESTDSDASTITIYHTNDMHGNVGGGLKNTVGLEYVSALKKSTANSLLVDGGDATQGFSFATFSQGKAPLTIMKLAGYDGMISGNHEFDRGMDVLNELSTYVNSGEGAFPMISANVLNESDNLPYFANKGTNQNNGQYFIKEQKLGEKTIKIGFFGLTTSSTKKNQKVVNTEGINFADEVSTAKSVIETLKNKENVDIVIGITHMGATGEGEYISSHEMVKELQRAGIEDQKGEDYYTPNIIIDAHSHTKESKVILNGEEIKDVEGPVNLAGNVTVIQQTGNNLSNLGKISISINEDNTKTAKFNVMSATEVKAAVSQPDTTVKAKYDEIWAEQAAEREKIVGKTGSTLYSKALNGADQNGHGGRIVRFTNTNISDLVTDGFRNEAEKLISALDDSNMYKDVPIIALQNGSAIAATSIETGDITNEDIININKFGGSLSVQLLNAQDIYDALEHGLSTSPKLGEAGYEKYGINTDAVIFLSVSGCRFTYDLSQDVGSRVQNVYLLNDNGTYSTVPLERDTNKKILMVTNDYLATGSDGFDMFSINKQVAGGADLNEVLSTYVTELTQKNGGMFIMPTNEKRKELLKENEYFDNFDSVITVDVEDKALVNTEVEVYLNDEFKGKYTTDDEGKITLNDLAPTGYNVTIKYNNSRSDGYIDGRTGITGDVSQGSDVDLGGTLKNAAISLQRPVYNGWQQNVDGNWKYFENGVAVKGWKTGITNFENYWFHFDETTAIMDTGWRNDIPNWEGQWFYFDKNSGIMATEWQGNIPDWEGQWFYFDKNSGIMATEWQNNIPGWSDKWFYFDKNSGIMATEWQSNIPGWEGQWFYFDKNSGTMTTDWKTSIPGWESCMFFFDRSNGTMYIGLNIIDGVEYLFSNNGVLLEKQ